MSSGVYRGKESSNRIELSRLVQDLLNFGVLGSLRLWGYGFGGGWGCPPHMCTCTCMQAHIRMHIYMLNMIISIVNGSPHWGDPWEFHMMSYACVRACVCMCAYACVLGAPFCHPHPFASTPPPPSGGRTPGISQNSIALELIKIFRFCLKIWNLWRLSHPWVVV